jgi:putative nucleotidyltransferase with HDIG domain
MRTPSASRAGFIAPGRQRAAGGAARQARDSSAESSHEPLGLGLALHALVAMVSLIGGALVVRGVLDQQPVDWPAMAVLVALAVVSERSDLSLYGNSRVSLAFVPIFAALVLSGMTGLAIVVPLAVLASSPGRPLYKTAFNFGSLMAAGAASVAVLSAFGSQDYSQGWPQVLGPVVLAGAANFVANSVLVACAIAFSSRSNIRQVWGEHFMWLWPHYILLAILGAAIVAAFEAMGIWGIAVFLVPPLTMRLSMKQYLDRTTKSVMELRATHGQLQVAHTQLTQAMASLGNAYDGTLRSLVAALDARDSETAGHSERVADLTMAIAEEMGLSPDTEQWRYISWGALLHDIGKIAIPDEILRKPGGLSEPEWEAMRSHPRDGWDILQSVDFLAPAADIVLAHHERFDGHGYPGGLAGEQVPLGARIFMIADAFDAMTSDRVYRAVLPVEEALAEVLRNSGTQFDPAAVRAFLTVYQKRFVGTVHHRQLHGNGSKHTTELSEALKQAIIEAAGLG